MVHATAVEGLKGGRLRVGMVGGGRNAFIGAVHRMAMRLDDLIRAERGRAVVRRRERARVRRRSRACARPRLSDYREMAAREAARPDGIEAVVIVTPNHLHYPVAKAFLEAGIDVICDKPLSTTLAEATELVELAAREGARLRRDAQQHRLSHGAPGARNDRRRRARRDPGRARRLYPGLVDAADRRRGPQAGGMAHRSRRARAPPHASPTSASMRTISRCSSPGSSSRRFPPISRPSFRAAGSTTTRMC